MNKSFRTIGEHAGIYFCPVISNSAQADVLCSHQKLEKFAELIVQECMDIVAARAFNDDDHVIHNNAVWCCYGDIREQLGK